MQQSTRSEKTIGIVDPDAAVRHSLAFALNAEGYQVLSCARGMELVALLARTPFHCFVVEYRLPEMTGMELVHSLRNRNIGAPVVMLATHPDQALLATAPSQNTTVIEKPLNGSAVIDAIRKAIG